MAEELKNSSEPQSTVVAERRTNRRRRRCERFPIKKAGESIGRLVSVASHDTECRLVEIGAENCTLNGDFPAVPGEDVRLEIKLRESTIVLAGSIKSTSHTGEGVNRYGVRFNEEANNILELLADKKTATRRKAVDLFSLQKKFSKRLEDWKKKEYYHYHRRELDGPQQARIDFTSNDYLALANNPRIKAAATAALNEHGLGTAGPTIFAGRHSPHDQLAATLAGIKKTEACLLCPSGFTANSGVFTGLINTPGTIIFLDEKDHASIFHGAMASKGRIKMFRHNDMDHLRRLISQYERTAPKVICVDGVYSMDGDMAPLDKIYEIAQEYNASLWLDDAHSFGVFGERGAGIESHFGLLGKIDIVTGSLSKTLGGFGGYVCTTRAVVDYLDHLGREFVYTTSLPAAICGGLLEGLKIMTEESDVPREKLWRNARLLKQLLIDNEFPVAPTDSPIVPVIFGHETISQRFAHDLAAMDIDVNAVTRPAVRRNESRLRITVRSDHEEGQIRSLVDAMCEVRTEIMQDRRLKTLMERRASPDAGIASDRGRKTTHLTKKS